MPAKDDAPQLLPAGDAGEQVRGSSEGRFGRKDYCVRRDATCDACSPMLLKAAINSALLWASKKWAELVAQ